MKLIIVFILLNIANVIIQTVKSIATIKCGKTAAAIINAAAYGLYTIVVVYTVCDLSLWFKVTVVAVANLIGVFIVKWLEEKHRIDKIWKIEVAIQTNNFDSFLQAIEALNISNRYERAGNYFIFHIFCENQKESHLIKELLDKYHAKFFVSETKTLY